MEQCNTCKFSVDSGSPVLMCRRFPALLKVAKAHWCGEYAQQRVNVETPVKRKKWKERGDAK